MSPFLRLQLLLLLGNISFVAAWALALHRPAGWRWMGILLLAFFVTVRVGGLWLRAKQFPEVAGRTRRATLFSTIIALLAVALWVYTALREPT